MPLFGTINCGQKERKLAMENFIFQDSYISISVYYEYTHMFETLYWLYNVHNKTDIEANCNLHLVGIIPK